MRRHRGVASFARSGGAKLKSGGQRFSPKCECEITNFPTKSDLQKGLRRNPKVFSGRNNKFSDQKQEKRSSPKFEGFFWPKSQILTFFPPQNTNFFLPKKYRGGQEKNRGGGGGGGAKTKIGGHCPPCPPFGDAAASATLCPISPARDVYLRPPVSGTTALPLNLQNLLRFYKSFCNKPSFFLYPLD